MKANIATANGLTRGQESAVLIKIAEQMGIENIQTAVEMFLRGTFEIVVKKIIDWLDTSKTTATMEKFVAEVKFKLKKDGGICSSFGENFQNWFLAGGGKIEDPIGEKELRFGKLMRNSLDGPIIEELGGEAKAETTLTEMYDQMSKQSKGEEGNLLVNGWANIFYIRDTSGVLRAVDVRWRGDGWRVNAHSVEDPEEWHDGYQVFSRNS